jgi:anti-sigma B factor antagonist
MMFDVQPSAEGTALRLIGELDLSTADDLLGRVEDRLVEGRGDLVIDASALAFIDSTGVKALVDIARRLGAGRELVIVRPSPPAARTLELLSASSFPNLVIRPSAHRAARRTA